MEIYLSALGAIISIWGAILTWVIARKSHSIDTREQLREAYLRMMAFRAEHPHVMHLARIYNPQVWSAMYGEDDESRKEWIEYYTYLEHCLIYGNLVLASHRLISPYYGLQSEPLVRLLLAEHYPAISDLIHEEYVSMLIRQYILAQAAAGRDWQLEHEQLPLPPQERRKSQLSMKTRSLLGRSG